MESLWMKDYPANYPNKELKGPLETDTAIIGGGLAGVLCAYLLKERGIDNVVVEAKRIGSGTTHNTTAKITAQHGLVYSKIEKQARPGAAKDYFDANQEAVEEYRRLCGGIPCDFEEKTAYVYSTRDRQKLKDEAAAYRRMGVEPLWLEQPPVPVSTVGALGMAGQAQFHPMKFLGAIAQKVNLYENLFAREILPGQVVTGRGTIRARRIVLATHYPMVNLRGLYFMKLYQHRSYVLALTGAPDPEGMYIDEQEGGLSFRTYREYLLLGGGGHPTGKDGGGFRALRHEAKAAYPGAQEQFAWATQDCMTLDSMPYIGRHRQNNRELFVATGFNKWGMTGAMAAARLLCDLIADGHTRYERLFNPSRSMLHPQLFLNVGQAAAGLLSFGKRCPHMGCALKWNAQERTWDCPCHGSRFDQNGNLIDNPAKRGIELG